MLPIDGKREGNGEANALRLHQLPASTFGALGFGTQGFGTQAGEPRPSSEASCSNSCSVAVTVETITDRNVEEAMGVISRCFSLPEDIGAARKAYARFIAGEHRFFSEFLNTDIVLNRYELFRVDGQPAGVSGIYHVVSEPGRIYMGWLGVSPEFRKHAGLAGQPLSDLIMEHTKSIGRQLGASELGAVAEDTEANGKTHRYYERHGFVVAGRFDRGGEIDRTYLCKL
jgi:GNAT superfamily N-acetyltransferase